MNLASTINWYDCFAWYFLGAAISGIISLLLSAGAGRKFKESRPVIILLTVFSWLSIFFILFMTVRTAAEFYRLKRRIKKGTASMEEVLKWRKI